VYIVARPNSQFLCTHMNYFLVITHSSRSPQTCPACS